MTKAQVPALAARGEIQPIMVAPVRPAIPTLRVCTVATSADLPAIRVLRTSFLHHHPDGELHTLIVDAEPGSVSAGMLTPADIGIDTVELNKLATACTPAELCAVLQPRLLSHLLADDVVVLYLDPHVIVLDTIAEQVLSAAVEHPVVLLPRVLRPLPRDGRRPGPADLLTSGTFDPAFLAVRSGSQEFLRTWIEQISQAPDTTGAFLDGAPALVEHRVLRDPGVGISAWNASQRTLARDANGTLLVDGVPLRTAHLTGFDPQRPWLLSTELADRPRVLLSEHPALAELCAGYRNDLVRAGYGSHTVTYRFAAVADGIALPTELRKEWLAAQHSATPPPPAFGVTATDFLRWACAPGDTVQAAVGGSRWAAALWREDSALQERFPAPFTADSTAFREWCATIGVTSGRLHPAAVPKMDIGRGPTLIDQLGVSVIGHGIVADLIRAGIRASGVPSADQPMYPVVLRCGDTAPVPADRYVISVLPEAHDRVVANELWVASESTRKGAQRPGRPPIRVITVPVPDRNPVTAQERFSVRTALRLTDEVVFAGIVDHAVERQGNALGLVSAFLSAFSDRPNVRLVLIVFGAQQHQEAAERLRLATAADSRILLVENDARIELLDAADCVVSLHRAEGMLGDVTALVLASVVARSLPVLATEHGAVAELLGSDAAMMVPCHPGGREPDVQAAIRLMRAIADNPRTAAELAAANRQFLLRTRGVAVAGEHFRERIEQAYRTWRARRAAARHGHIPDPLRPLQSAKHALLRRADPAVASRMPMAPALRKAVLRILSHYDNHLREVLNAVVDGVERTATELARRQQELDTASPVSQDLSTEVAELTDRQAQLDDQLIGIDDGVVRARADLATQGRRLRALEEALVTQSLTRDRQIDALAERMDRLTVAVERTLDRIDSVETKMAHSLRERDGKAAVGIRTAAEALRIAQTLRGLAVREHQRESTNAVVFTDAGILHIPGPESSFSAELTDFGRWQPEICDLIDSLLPPGGILLDVGAHIGYHAIRVLNRPHAAGAVIAVEPASIARELLQHNVDINLAPAVIDQLVLLDTAAWDSKAELNLGGSSELVSGARLDKTIEAIPDIGQQPLSVVRIGFSRNMHRALGGLVRLLRRDRPHIICSFDITDLRQQQADPLAVLQEFSMWGYQLIPFEAGEPLATADVISLAEQNDALTLWLRPS